MKQWIRGFALLLIFAPFSVVSTAHGVIIGLEPFAYADGLVAGKSGGAFWDWQNFSPSNHTSVPSDWNSIGGAPAVISGRLVTDNSAARREYNGANENFGAVNDFNVFKQVYYKLTVTTGATLPDFFGVS